MHLALVSAKVLAQDMMSSMISFGFCLYCMRWSL